MDARDAAFSKVTPNPLPEEMSPRVALGKRPMRILMVTARYYPLMGGIEAHTHEVGRQLAARGHSVTVLTTDPTGNLAAREHREGVDVLRVPAWPKGSDYYFAPGIADKIGSEPWDVIHVQGYHTLVAPLAMATAIRRKVPFVITFHSGGHSSRLRNSIRPIQHALLQPLVRRANQLVAVSNFEADFFSSRLRIARDRFAVIQNGSRLPVPGPHCSRDQGQLIVSVGRLERYKGHHRAILAFSELTRQMPQARLRIVGEGPYEKPLRQLVRALNLEERVVVGGIPPHDRQGMADMLGNARLVVLLSEYEAHPVAIIEALAIGCNVLVSDTSGLREIADKGLCASVPLGASSREVARAMATELSRVRKVPEEALPDWNSCADQLLQVYARVIADK
jgi:glycosyltransferase involved in cell wall biosynthesis